MSVNITKDSKILIIPNSESSKLVLISLPHPKSKQFTRFAYSSNSFYEILKINGSNPHSKSLFYNDVIRDGIYKSILLQPLNDNQTDDKENEDNGFAIEDPTYYTLTPFNPIYLILDILIDNKDRFLSFDDIIEKYESLIENKEALIIPHKLFEKSLKPFTDFQNLGNEIYYKLSELKFQSFINSKIKSLNNFFQNNRQKNSIVTNFILPPITPLLSTTSETTSENKTDENLIPTPEIINQSYTKTSFSILSSYLSQTSLTFLSLLTPSLFQFKELEIFIKYSKQHRKNVENARKHMEEMLISQEKENILNKKKTITKQPLKRKLSTKKTVKVQTGKGSIDSFFSKKPKTK